jgi:penicillin-insensitive murein endopeptidase
MRARRLFVLLFALGSIGSVLIGQPGTLPARLSFILPSFADADTATTDPSHSATHVAGKDQKLPDFVPGSRTLTFADGSDAGSVKPNGKPGAADHDPDPPKPAPAVDSPGARPIAIKVEPIPGTPQATTGSVGASSKLPAWPEIIGAKNLFGAVKKPAPMSARAIGTYARGCLSGAVALPIDGPAWQEMRLSRNRNWGHPKLIALVEEFAKDAQKLDGWPGLLVGDIAQPRGGPMVTGHASHQIGLDADIWLTPMPDHRLTTKEREDMEATSMLDSTGVAVDPKVFTDKQVALIKRAASYPEVERIFVHPAIKKALCKAAGKDRAWLGKVRPWYGHYYHFHMRIKCPAGFAGCKPQPPPTGDDGCGKEVDQWLAKVIPSKKPPAPPSSAEAEASLKAPRAPVMLSELPTECRGLLAAGPDPVPVPKEALMTPAAVKQALAKAAAARAAFVKAKGGPGTAATVAGKAATSPALRPHLHKAVSAEKK